MTPFARILASGGRPSALVLLVCGLTSLTGCGVIKIDVDVYKGPLQNQLDVQTQQIAYMAQAAKPLLVRLRADLERRERECQFPNDATNRDRVLAELSSLGDGWVDTDPKHRNVFQFYSGRAAQVNRILARYNSRWETVHQADVVQACVVSTTQPSVGEELLRGVKAKAVESGFQASLVADDKEEKLLWEAQSQARNSKVGLKSRIDTYATAQHAYRGADEGPDREEKLRTLLVAREELYDYLVQFSELITFPADLDRLFDHGTGSPIQGLRREINQVVYGNSTKTINQDEYIRVLQAIGYSILTHVDDLRQHASHDDALRKGRDREAEALDRAFPRDARLALDRIAATLQSQADGLSARLPKLEKAKQDADDRLTKAEAKVKAGGQVKDATDELTAAKVAAKQATDDLIKAGRDFVRFSNARGQVLAHKQEFLARAESVGQAPSRDTVQWNLLALIKADAEKASKAFGKGAGRSSDEYEAAVKSVQIEKSLHDLAGGTNVMKPEALRAAWLAETAVLLGSAGKDLADAISKGDEEKIRDTKARVRRLKATQVALTDLDDHIGDLKDDVPANVAAALVDRLTQLANASQLADAASVLSEAPLPFDVVLRANVEGDSRTVLDQLIATLRYEYLETVKESGKESTKAKMIADAIESAYEQRSGMIYIRPAWAYLRNSYPSSSLQNDPGLPWKNMLSEHMFRQVPELPELLGRSTDSGIVSELDKQYWQNVNQVRVAGGGITNYVVAKDDIGNWYVKNYSADPGPIIKAAKSLALFSVGPQLGAVAAQRQQAVGAGKAATATTQPTTAGKQFDNEEKKFSEDTAKDRKDTLTAARDLATTVQGAWDNDPSLADFKDKLKDAAASPKATYLDKLPDPGADVKAGGTATTKPAADASATPSDQIIDALRAMRQFHNALVPAIADALSKGPKADVKDEQAKLKAADDELAAVRKKAADKQPARDKAKADLDAAADKTAKANAALTAAKAAAKDNPKDPDLVKAQGEFDAASNAQEKPQTDLDAAEKELKDAQADVTKKQEARDSASKAVDERQKKLDAANAAAATAQREMRDVVRDTIKKFTDRRDQVLTRFDTAVQIIGESTGGAAK